MGDDIGALMANGLTFGGGWCLADLALQQSELLLALTRLRALAVITDDEMAVIERLTKAHAMTRLAPNHVTMLAMINDLYQFLSDGCDVESAIHRLMHGWQANANEGSDDR